MSATATIKHKDITLFFIIGLIKSISNCSRRRFIDNTKNFKACNSSRVLCCLPLRIIEIRRDSNNYLFQWMTQERFGSFFEALNYHGRNLLRVKALFFFLIFNINQRLIVSISRYIKRP